MAVRAPRLAGITFAPAGRSQALADVLPRMDVAAFVGFAAHGPLHEPTVIEDGLQFAAIFGDDLALAWDHERGETAYAYLAPAVRTFFRNGGQRCWVVRVPRPSGDVGTFGGLALFAGFAASGPVSRPLLVKDKSEFEAIFGAAPPEWLNQRDVPAAVTLADTVGAFFTGGGSSCRVLRLPDLEADPTIPIRADLFLDPDLPKTGGEALIAQADFLRYQSSKPRELLGLHALIGIEEMTLVAVPDAHGRGWQVNAPEQVPPEPPPVSSAAPLECDPVIPPDEPGQFAPCGIVPMAPLAIDELRVSRPRADLLPAPELGSQSWLALLDVQRALLQMCAARGDALAILSVPIGFSAQDARDHAVALQLKSAGDGAQQVLQVEDARMRSFGALYHPWLVGRDEIDNAIRQIPPDGAICGMIARRTLARGAWVAPANEPLVGVVALAAPHAPVETVLFSPPAAPTTQRNESLLLQEAGINLISRTPRGFLTLSANTLAVVRRHPDDELRDQQLDDTELRPINVRRLLIMLRRLALLRGVTYVFEPNSPAFRRQVQRGFEALLEGLYLRGAFAGASAADAFQVNLGPTLNTQATIDRGLLIIELRVAPARPLSFLTVRLVRSGEQGLQVQEF